MQNQRIGSYEVESNDADSIDLVQLLHFMSENWKRIVFGALAGALLGFTGWMVMAKYEAESVLINNGALTFMSWRGLQKNLPILASQMSEAKQIKPDQERVFKQLSDAKWFGQNVTPTYSLTKTDTKDLATISKELQESGGTNILNLVVRAKGASIEDSLKNVRVVTDFVKQGSAYLSIKNLINGYETQVLDGDSDIAKKILDTEVDLNYLRERSTKLEALKKQFPQNATMGSQQIMDLKDSNAKFMPISTQLVAINTDINNSLESLKKLHDQQAQTRMLKDFVATAGPLIANENNGLVLCDELLTIEAALRETVSNNDTNSLQMLNSIRASLNNLKTWFSKSLDTDLIPQVTKPGPILPTFGGLMVGVVLALFYAAFIKFLPKFKPV